MTVSRHPLHYVPEMYLPSASAVKNIDRQRHIAKTAQDKLPASERPRVKAWQKRLNNMKENS